MHTISNSVVKKDHAPKMEGRSVYVCDIDKHGILCGKILRSKYARAKLLSVKVPELPDGYYYVDRNDVPGDNNVNIVMDDTPVYARETVEYIGEPIGMVCGPDEAVCEDILRRIEVEYEELDPMLDLRKADEVFFNYEYEKGDIDKAFAEADKVYTEEFETGYQDQTYLETQGMMAEPEEGGRMFVHGSMQCAYYVHGAVMRALNCGPADVHIHQDVTGGGFGAPQTFFAVEMMMDHIAKDLGVDTLEFKEAHLVKQGDATSTSGKYHFPVPLPAMVDEVDKACDLRRKHKEYAKPQTGRYRRGIGFSMHFHGAGFTGSGERDLIKAVARLHKYKDGTVEILASNGEIGQGLRTTFPKIVAHELNLPLEKVFYDHPDTSRVPDSGPTVASRSLMTVGELLRRAAIKLRTEWKDGEDQIVEEKFVEPDFMIPFYLDKFRGDAYPTYAWGAQAIEVEVDTYTGIAKILGAYASFDVGTPMDYNIVMGQMEGGFLQGIGYASTEFMNYDNKGRIRNNSFSDYLIPTAVDVPVLNCQLHVEEYPFGPYGAKGAGELPLVGAAKGGNGLW